jgi:hypothetical protein
MPDQGGTLEALARELGRALLPLKDRLSEGQVKDLFTELGLTIPGATPLPPAFVSALGDAINAATQLPPLLVQLEQAVAGDDTGAMIGAGVAIAKDVTQLVLALQTVGSAFGASSGGLPGVQPADVLAFAGELAERVAEYALLTYLEGYWPALTVVLRAIGVVDVVHDPGRPGDDTKPPGVRRSLHLDRLSQLLTKPIDHFETLYGWGSPTFDAQRLLEVVHDILFLLAAPAKLEPVAPASTIDQLRIGPFRLVPETAVNPRGISLRFDTDLGNDLGFKIPFIGGSWTLGVAVQGALGTGVGVMFQPPFQASFVPAGGAGFKLTLEDGPTQPIVLLSLGGASEVTIASFNVYVAADFHGSSADVDVGGGVKGGKVVIDTSGSDGFLAQLLSGVHIESTFDLGFGYSTAHGLHFDGAGALEIQLPTHISLGPIELDALTISVGFKDGGFPVGLTTDVKAALGPLDVSVEGIGFQALFTLKGDNKGNLGPVDLTPSFRPPRGAGLSIDTGIVKGGGYLYFDPDKGEYAGVAELSIADLVTVKAIGLISTKMPDGTDGFSLLIIISAEFTPIQLGFGFTLNGVGGLLGLNRSVVLDVLRDGVRTGAIDSIMFPTDIVANAPRIISDLKAVFPPHDGTFLIGPMAKFGWGTPSLVTLSLGIIVEIPPGNIAILGILKVALPDEDTALIQIQVNFLGVLDFDEQLLSFDASLFDSHVLFMTLEGDMAVRLKWGDNAGFLLSVGGFHPAFTPPSGLHLPATMKRLTISIIDTSFARIKIDNYFAVTSNTVQFGAHAYLFFGVDEANINGEVGFDVLFQFSPFYFNAMITGSLSIQVFGLDLLSISLKLSLEGPSPWRAKGTGSISILFFSIDVSFDITWGDPKDTSLPPVHVMPLFLAEVDKDQNWKALPPPQSNLLVSLRKLDEGLLVLHPFGALTISQRAMPLGLTLDKLGSQKPDDVSQVDITAATSGGTPLALTPVDEQFAIAQYQAMSDDEKLSRPSFQEMKGGVIVGTSEAMQSSKMTRRTIAYELVIEDKESKQPLPVGVFYRAAAGLFHPFLNGNAAARSSLSFAQKVQLSPFAEKIAVGPAGHTVARTLDNTPHDAGSRFGSEAKARDYMNARIAADPSLAGTLHVLPNHEVNEGDAA